MAFARQILKFVLAAAVALAPLGAANAAAHMHSAAAPIAAMNGHHHDAAPAAAKAAHNGMKCCPGTEHGKSNCSQVCLQKCFGPLAVMPAGSSAPAFAVRQFAISMAAPLSDWTSRPQPPPPRT